MTDPHKKSTQSRLTAFSKSLAIVFSILILAIIAFFVWPTGDRRFHDAVLASGEKVARNGAASNTVRAMDIFKTANGPICIFANGVLSKSGVRSVGNTGDALERIERRGDDAVAGAWLVFMTSPTEISRYRVPFGSGIDISLKEDRPVCFDVNQLLQVAVIRSGDGVTMHLDPP